MSKKRNEQAARAAELATKGLSRAEIAAKMHIREPLVDGLVAIGRRLERAAKHAQAPAEASCVPLNAVPLEV